MANSVTSRQIIVRTTFDAVHQWKDAPTNPKLISSILGYPHRHKFYVEVRIPVTDPDRQIEFLQFKETLDSVCQSEFINYPRSAPIPYSCETMAEIIGKALIAYDSRLAAVASFTVAVFEDNENGGEVTFA